MHSAQNMHETPVTYLDFVLMKKFAWLPDLVFELCIFSCEYRPIKFCDCVISIENISQLLTTGPIIIKKNPNSQKKTTNLPNV